ncbi:alpha-glucuronidase family glycosyl hydrolase [Sphingosinicella sp. BN140058]|uniref:alpha-glucuronidase family glycosyl hydrolase n=1 Tax=Sphingosinicella sp. BN140058 TaxID=1892855 RepID=UPI0010131638|nr:alpha-glucuronidase family glycosyl hydrolase [Sphingosinicella sp. BN140058]QAY77877.1 alpha-glucuronidase [Sphingosinicella sp. BN140058]
MGPVFRLILATLLAFGLAGAAGAQAAEDGYDLWLRYRALPAAAQPAYAGWGTELVTDGDTPTLRIAAAELERGLTGLLGRPPVQSGSVSRDGAILLGIATSPKLAGLDLPTAKLGREGYAIRSARIRGRDVTVIAANTEIGLLYGAFRLLKQVQTAAPITRLDILDAPKVKLRMLNHWDNLDRTVERGYAGFSLWDWHKLPDYRDPRYTDYARANASIGINGTVLTNVNANADILTPAYLEKVKALADVFRPYGIRVYLTARFSAPLEIGGLKTADPLDPKVRAWWRAKADEIYRTVPDFGGFLVKANSEGQPGPQDYKRNHADGANMLADAVKPHGGIVMWRAFVYAAENVEDRAKQAYSEFKPLDGKFRDNVVVQVKNGAIDFQPREPFHPLFGAMPKTPLMMEFQITKEYLGFATHLAYLGSAWEEVLAADTHARGKESSVAKVIDGSIQPYSITGMAGVANIGDDRNWTGSHFDQANWYAFGRLAWDPESSSRDIAEEWARMTFSTDPAFVRPAVGMMMASHQAVVDYMTPLGLHHLMATGHHYGPGPWVGDLARPDWNPTYYHRADASGIGFDRTGSGSNAIGQYAPNVARSFADPKSISEDYLLWFHHLPWDWRMKSGRPLWDELVLRYGRGVDAVGQMRATWNRLEPFVDPRRFADVTAFLGIQHKEAQWWRDASVAYFQSISKRPLPAGAAPPPHDLDWYKALQFKYAPGHH